MRGWSFSEVADWSFLMGRGEYSSNSNYVRSILILSRSAGLSFQKMLDLANTCDDLIYQRLAADVELPEELNDWHIPEHAVRCTLCNRGAHLDPLYQKHE